MQPRLLWSPSDHFKKNSNLKHFMLWLAQDRGLQFNDYHALWNWSVSEPESFWRSLWDYFKIMHDGEVKEVISKDPMPHTKWFEGTHLSYAEHIFRNSTDEHPAIICKSEGKATNTLSWKTLTQQVASVQAVLRTHGITSGDT